VTDGSSAEPEVRPWRVRRPRATAGFLSPAVRRAARERGMDPSALAAGAGSGAQGRVTLADLDTAVATVPIGATAVVAPVAPAAPVAPIAPTAPSGDERVPFTRVQARAGTALLASKHTAAHALTIVHTDYSAVDVARQEWRVAFREQEGFSLTYLPFVARAVCDALRDYPLFNATLDVDDRLTVHRAIGLGIAVDLAHQGLVVPVVHDADGLRLRTLARAIDDVARRARAKRMTPDDTVGGSFTITNPGAAGTAISVPIINRPQVGILSTDGVRKEVVAIGSSIEIRPMGYLCLSFDHRAVDGAYAASFAARVRAIVETRDWLREL
jgi:2-oxoglutarate dehydrogenase E2 component (dihydrolipoamide succinyltransferase)